MREPNFSESQLQQATNTSYIRRLFENHGHWYFAHVPSLWAEFDLGWDSAFYLRWLEPPPNPKHAGCNFFIQYKISGQLTSSGAKEWLYWGEEYFRFKIPDSTRDDNGDFIDDYHQWNRLKALAKKNYPTFYATNSTLKKATLEKAFRAGTLLNSVPVLDVRTIDKKHKHVTFTPTSHVFALHSEVEYENKLSFADAIDSLAREEHSPFEESTNKLIETLKEVGDNSESWNLDLAQLERVRNLPSALRIWAKRSFLQSFVRKHVGASLFWLPKAG